MRYLILCLAFFNAFLFAAETSQQDLSLTEALELFFEKNGGDLEQLRPRPDPADPHLADVVRDVLIDLSMPDEAQMECKSETQVTEHTSNF